METNQNDQVGPRLYDLSPEQLANPYYVSMVQEYMAPTLKPGDRLIGYPIPADRWDETTGVVLLELVDRCRIVGRLQEVQTDAILLRFDHPAYSAQTYPKSLILGLYQVWSITRIGDHPAVPPEIQV